MLTHFQYKLLISLLVIHILNSLYKSKLFTIYTRSLPMYLPSVNNINNIDNTDPFETFSLFDKFLFNRFAIAVTTEINDDNNIKKKESLPANYHSLIKMINKLTFTRNSDQVSNQSKNMLVRLFPKGLLPAYKLLFSRFQNFSALMNTWVTHYTTIWLMGPSKVEDLTIDNEIYKDQCLVIEKCRFLESSGCIQTCLHACKIPTQRFFYEEMGLPVTLKPNFTDFSCRFEFGIESIPLDKDLSIQVPCLSQCINNKNKLICD